MSEINLPAWATLKGKNRGGMPVIEVDPDKMYPALLEEYGVDKPDQYWLEVCFQSMKLDLQQAAGTIQIEIHIRADGGRKERWRQDAHPEGKAQEKHNAHRSGVEAASRGLEARHHYKKLRGVVPNT